METIIVGMLKCNNGMSINALPLFQYSLDSPYLNMTKVEKNRVTRTYIINLEIIKHGSAPKYHYKTHFLYTSEDGFIIKPPYMDIHLSYGAKCDRAAVNFIKLVRE